MQLATPRPPRAHRKSERTQKMVPIENSRSAKLASSCYHTSKSSKEFVQALTDDLLNARLPDRTVNTALNGTRTFLKLVDMEMRYGTVENENESPNLLMMPDAAPSASGEVVK